MAYNNFNDMVQDAIRRALDTYGKAPKPPAYQQADDTMGAQRIAPSNPKHTEQSMRPNAKQVMQMQQPAPDRNTAPRRPLDPFGQSTQEEAAWHRSHFRPRHIPTALHPKNPVRKRTQRNTPPPGKGESPPFLHQDEGNHQTVNQRRHMHR